jgi:hypothetical protein
MATANSKWYGKDVKNWINANYDKRINLAGEVVRKELKRVLSNPGRTVTERTSKSGKVRKIYGEKEQQAQRAGTAAGKAERRIVPQRLQEGQAAQEHSAGRCEGPGAQYRCAIHQS